MTVAPVLDAEKGERALAAYRRFRRQLCADLDWKRERGLRAAARLKEQLGRDDLGPEQLCGAGRIAKALASGALLDSGRDEVLLQVRTLLSAQTGQSMAVMRDDGTGYRLVRHMLDAGHFEARLRLVAPGRRDIVLLCEYRGLGGVYPGICGFFGRGAFAERAPMAEGKDDLSLIEVIEERSCGGFENVSAGKVVTQSDQLVIELVLEKGVYVPGRLDNPGACGNRETKSRRSFDIEYKFDGKNFRRVTPTPKTVQAVLDKG